MSKQRKTMTCTNSNDKVSNVSIRDVSVSVWTRIKTLAARNNLSIAEILEVLVDTHEAPSRKRK